MKGFLYKNL